MEHDRKELIELIIYVLQHIGTGSPENFGSNGPPTPLGHGGSGNEHAPLQRGLGLPCRIWLLLV